MHLVIYFCGTGNPGADFIQGYDYANQPGIKTIFVQGCDTPQVCNSTLFPNLKEFAGRFTNKAFVADGKELHLTRNLVGHVGIASEIEVGKEMWNTPTNISNDDAEEEIESFTLCGYSRGAVTCFEEAKELFKIAPHIPVDIVADQPVPGNCYQGPGTNAASVADCSHLTNLRNVTVIAGAYTGRKSGGELYIKSSMPGPEELMNYKNRYIYIKGNPGASAPQLFHVNDEGKAQPLELSDIAKWVFKERFINPDTEGKYFIPKDYFRHLIKDFNLLEHPDSNKFEDCDIIHRGFFSQIIPKLPRTAHRDLIIIPRESHHQDRTNSPDGEHHLNMQVAKYLHEGTKNQKGVSVISEAEVKRKTEQAAATYSTTEGYEPAPFPPVSQMQSFFGFKKDEVYNYLDKLHPAAHLRKGMQWEPQNEKLMDWWIRQEKKVSRFSTQLTKDLVKTIETTDQNDSGSLKKLFAQADQWLILKEDSSSSRYYQVESLRNNIYHQLIKQNPKSKAELAQINRDNLKATDYFLNHWTKASAAASWFKTDTTRALDLAVEKHAKGEPSKMADFELIQALDAWIDTKKNSNSKRFDIVVQMREHLQEVFENTYSVKLDDEYKLAKGDSAEQSDSDSEERVVNP